MQAKFVLKACCNDRELVNPEFFMDLYNKLKSVVS